MRLSVPLLVFLFGCPNGGDGKPVDDTGESPADAVCDEPVEPECVDAMIQDLSLHDDMVSEGEVTTESDGEDFVTYVDASAGGYSQSSENPWVYVRFDSDGAHRVDIDDETALESMDWHLSLRRFIIRVNSGDSGPSCVGAATMLGYEYGDLTSVPDGLSYAYDDYYSEDCTIINDSSGLPGSPQVAMASWWEYPDCVATTGTPFLIQLDDGRIIKLVVEAYYEGNGQEECNEDHSTMEAGGYYQLRWREM